MSTTHDTEALAPATPSRTDDRATGVAFSRRASCGLVTIEPFAADPYAVCLRRWLAHPASAAWQMAGLSTDEVRAYLAAIDADPHQQAWLGRVDGEPTFFVETYDPAEVLLTEVHDAEPGDVGMHLLVAPPRGQRVHGLTSAVMASVVDFVFGIEQARRIVVEPDVANDRIAAKNDEVGFRALGEVELPDKTARLSVLTRHDRAASHLAPGPMEWAHRHLVAKALGEFAHERLIAPVADGTAAPATATAAAAAADASGTVDGYWLVALDHDGHRVEYRFVARRQALEHWSIDETTVTRTVDGHPEPLDALALIVELDDLLGIPESLLATYLEEVSSTLASAAYKRHRGGPTAEQLTTADFQTVEAAMTEGHPGFVANNGRIGLGLDEFHAFAPEAAAPVRLVWLAARRSATHLALGAGLDERSLWQAELGPETVDRFDATLAAKGLDPAAFHYLPVHPWQWQHRVAISFAPDVARRDLVLLGEGDDTYQAQQSIRTFANRSRPDRHYVKTALAIQNMGFVRGLSPAYMRPTPAINDWVHDLVRTDATLQEARFRVLRERASVGYTGDVYHRTTTSSPHRKMIAALWRESPVPLVGPGERLATMAALLHRDGAGDALASALVKASGVGAETWLRSYLHAYLRPVVHCLRAHDLAFMPHGENVILVLEGCVPTAAFMKDIGEEIVVVAPRAVPEAVRRTVHPVDDREKALAVFTDVFDGVFRHLAAILDGDGVLPAARFWALVAECVDRHADEHPDLPGAVDLRAARFDHSCLNRLQLRDTRQMVDLAAQSSSLIYAGTLANPIAR
ncbi:GNAT family N-acetyltransferase [Frigoribacterium sp. MCBA15_019]|uniref:GNAT family N-acetyltransferase n=1 Tax=Frigoribacterium sp. MCBA15_019 TaxID=1898745 RepID=UPI0009F288CB|nr:GNAT family N-acetyltransferase [Frigoribacterium sp. MCBA15_019]